MCIRHGHAGTLPSDSGLQAHTLLPSEQLFHGLQPFRDFEMGGFHEDKEPFHRSRTGQGGSIDLHGGEHIEKGFMQVRAQPVDFDGREQDVTYLAEHDCVCFLIDD